MSKQSIVENLTRGGVYSAVPAYSSIHGSRADTQAYDTARLYVELDDEKGDLKRFEDNVAAYLGQKNIADSAITMGIVGGKGKGVSLGYVDFFLTSIQMSLQEKMQVHDTVGDNYVSYFFGQSPPLWGLQGILLNTRQDDWSAAFHILYDAVMRGTRMADLKKVVHLRFNRSLLTGVFTQLNQTLEASTQTHTMFGASILVKSYRVTLERGRLPTSVTNTVNTIHEVEVPIYGESEGLFYSQHGAPSTQTLVTSTGVV